MKRLFTVVMLSLLVMGFSLTTSATADEFFHWNLASGSDYVNTLGNWLDDVGNPATRIPGDDVGLVDYVYHDAPGTMLIDDTHLFGGEIRNWEIGGDASGGNVEHTSGQVNFRYQLHIGYGDLAGSSSSYVMTGGYLEQTGTSYTTIGGNGSNGSMTISGGTSDEDRPYYRCTSGNQFRVGYGTDGSGTFTMEDWGKCQLGKFIRLGYGTNVTGTMNMSDDTYANIYKKGDSSYIGNGAGSTGTLNMSGNSQFKMQPYGEETGGTIFIGRAGASGALASGTINLSGNAYLKTIGQINAGNNDYCRATINVTGSATFESVNTIYFGVTGLSTTITEMNIDTGTEVGATGGRFETGGQFILGRGCITTVNLSETGSIGVGTVMRLADNGGTAVFNLDGGTLECDEIETVDGDETVGTSMGTLNFNGGVLQATGDNADMIHVDASYASQTLNVMAGGAIIDTNGYAIGINQALICGEAYDGGLTKLGDGTLTLSGANTYNGDTSVEAGTLSITGNTMLSDEAILSIASGAVMDLAFTGSAEAVGSLYLGGSAMAIGTWGSSASGATHVDDTYFSGTGTISVGFTLIPGDTNYDNIVNDTDATTVASNWGQTGLTGGETVGDFNYDGAVNAIDASIMAANWGDHNESEGTVPEPGLLALMASLGMMLATRRTRR